MNILKPHVSLNVSNIDASVLFYEKAFGVSATKRRPGYAKFDLVSPSLNLTMQEAPLTGVNASHFGFQRIEIPGAALTLLFDQKKCIHSRWCVTEAPNVFLPNVVGPWIKPDELDAELLAGIAHVCPSGAIRYRRTDGHADEQPPIVNTISIREGGPYGVRAELSMDGEPTAFYRATLCRCGASKNKPFCDSSHHAIGFAATGEPETIEAKAAMLEVRNGAVSIDPQVDGPYAVAGNVEIISGTGRVVARMQSAKLCRCGGSRSKPFCDGTHAVIGFRSDK